MVAAKLYMDGIFIIWMSGYLLLLACTIPRHKTTQALGIGSDMIGLIGQAVEYRHDIDRMISIDALVAVLNVVVGLLLVADYDM